MSEAAEHSASEIQRAAEDDARELREDASSEANATRENAHREAREYLDKVSASTSAMLERLNAMEQEMHAMIESVRTGSGAGIGVSEYGVALAAMEAIEPSGRTNSISSGRMVFFIQKLVITS